MNHHCYRRLIWAAPLWGIAIGLPAWTAELPSCATARRNHSERLVYAALQAEVSRDAKLRDAYLEEALREIPNLASARWHTGYVLHDDKWLLLPEAERRAAADPRRDEYQRLRISCGSNVADQLALARWCRKYNLDRESRVHWTKVLELQAHHPEAIRALHLRSHDGSDIPLEQYEKQRESTQQAKSAMKRWKPRVAGWMRAIEQGNTCQHMTALRELEAITNPEVIPALELILARDISRRNFLPLGQALVRALSNIPQHDATVSLARQAVRFPSPEVRACAADILKERPLESFVPLLLAGLAAPIESSIEIETLLDGTVRYQHSLYREGPEHDVSQVALVNIVRNSRPGWILTEQSDPWMRQATASVQRRARVKAAQVEKTVTQANARQGRWNDRIYQVLTRATGMELDPEPTVWWDWWRDYNELYSQPKPVYTNYYSETQYYHALAGTVSPVPFNLSSCFAKGTMVWTQTGPASIESVQVDDLVLSQDPNTGELGYQPVLETTVRPPAAFVRIHAGTEWLAATRGHRFWVSGEGWVMAKHLESGNELHTVSGGVTIDQLEPLPAGEAHNLVIANSHTYFVGRERVLVHDNTLPKPTTALVPGLLREQAVTRHHATPSAP